MTINKLGSIFQYSKNFANSSFYIMPKEYVYLLLTKIWNDGMNFQDNYENEPQQYCQYMDDKEDEHWCPSTAHQDQVCGC